MLKLTYSGGGYYLGPEDPEHPGKFLTVHGSELFNGITLQDFYFAVGVLETSGLIARMPGPRLVPGPKFAEIKAKYLATKETE